MSLTVNHVKMHYPLLVSLNAAAYREMFRGETVTATDKICTIVRMVGAQGPFGVCPGYGGFRSVICRRVEQESGALFFMNHHRSDCLRHTSGFWFVTGLLSLSWCIIALLGAIKKWPYIKKHKSFDLRIVVTMRLCCPSQNIIDFIPQPTTSQH
jgi:hypothetical protein